MCMETRNGNEYQCTTVMTNTFFSCTGYTRHTLGQQYELASYHLILLSYTLL